MIITGIRLVLVVLAVVVAFAVAMLLATMSAWHRTTRDNVARMHAASTAKQGLFLSTSLGQVPPPVARYFRGALHEGQPLVVSALA